ncbi:TPA: hypothetical protein ACNH8R_002226 [Pseudomonas aeruginosa]
MSEPRTEPSMARRPRTLSWSLIIQWAWLVALSILVILGWRSTLLMEEPQAAAAAIQNLQSVEARVFALEESNQARLVQAPSATQQALQSLRESLEGRMDRLESQVPSEGLGSDLEALRIEIEQLKTQLAALKVTERAAPRTVVRPAPKARPAAPREEPLPFRVLGVERRAGQLSVSVAPAEGALTAGTIQIVLPGESLGQWRLDSVEGNAAVFRSGEQTRRLALP